MFIFTVMMSMVANAQSFSKADAEELAGLNFDWSVETVKAAPATKTTTARRSTRSVSVNQLSAASARRNSSTARPARRAAAAPAAQSYSYSAPQNDVQQQLQATLDANTSSQVLCGKVLHNYIEGDGTTTLQVELSDWCGTIMTFTMTGYINVAIPVYQGDYICFNVYYNGSYNYPQVRYSELINVTGTDRCIEKYTLHRFGGNTAMMLANTPGASKWQKIASNVMAGAMTTAMVIRGAKEIINIFK